MSPLSDTSGQFVWRERLGRDLEGTRHFYESLFGWRWAETPMGDGRSYWMARLGERQVAGLMSLAHIPGGEAIPPHWSLYVSVADLEAAAARVEEAGGRLLMPVTEIPGIGHFAPIQDPQGSVINLFRRLDGDEAEVAPGPGEFCWEHLNTTEPPAAIEFYSKVVGWGTQRFGELSFFTRDAAQIPVAVVTQVPEGIPAHWLTYVCVASLGETVEKARSLGATVIEPRIEVPGKGAFALLQDPEGAFFMLSEPA